MVEATVTLMMMGIIFAVFGLVAWPLVKWLGVDEIVEDIEKAHKCANTRRPKAR